MIIKVGDEYLDYDAPIEMERQAKLFESIQETSGDFSYSFDLPDTSKNRRLLGIQNINSLLKPVYQFIEAGLQNDSGLSLYMGSIRIEKITNVISCSFFSGNNNWIQLIQGNVLDIDWSELDIAKDDGAVVSTWTSGNDTVIFPIVDKGALDIRLGQALANNSANLNLGTFDFHPFYFVQTIIKKLFLNAGLKISGELVDEVLYQKLITTSNRGDSRGDRIAERTAEVGRNSSQALSTSETKLQLTDAAPFSDGDKNLWDSSTYRYTADVGMLLIIDTNLNTDSDQNYTWSVKKNGTIDSTYVFRENDSSSNSVQLASGDYVEVFLTASSGTPNLLTGSSVTFTPQFFDYIYASDYLPDMDQSEFIQNIFKMFNVVVAYDPYTKTVDTRIFKKIKEKPVIDLSQYVDSYDIDFYEFIQNYAKVNRFVYAENTDIDIEAYNKANDILYGDGIIELDNKYLPEEAEIVNVSFSPVFTYVNNGFNAPLARLNYLTYERLSDTEFAITSVTDNGGIARFNVPGAMPIGLIVGRVVEIFNSDNAAYNGTGVVAAVTGSYFELVNVRFINDATASFNLVVYNDVPNDSTIIMVNSFVDVSDFSGLSEVYVNSTSYTEVPYASFDRPKTGRDIDGDIYSLSFSPVNQLNSYQVGLIDNYYSDLKLILVDPVKVFARMNIPEVIFRNIDFTQNLRVETKDFTALFYGNRITGYNNSYTTCVVELVKK